MDLKTDFETYWTLFNPDEQFENRRDTTQIENTVFCKNFHLPGNTLFSFDVSLQRILKKVRCFS